MKLRITIDSKVYEAIVEVMDADGVAPEYPPYPPAPATTIATEPAELVFVPQTTHVESNDKECRSPVTGIVIKIAVEPGQAVQANDVILILESMKMEMQITAPLPAVVRNVLVTEGTSVKVNQLLVEFE